MLGRVGPLKRKNGFCRPLRNHSATWPQMEKRQKNQTLVTDFSVLSNPRQKTVRVPSEVPPLFEVVLAGKRRIIVAGTSGQHKVSRLHTRPVRRDDGSRPTLRRKQNNRRKVVLLLSGFSESAGNRHQKRRSVMCAKMLGTKLIATMALTLLIGGTAAMAQTKGAGSSGGGSSTIPEAPIGHRQPRPDQMPSEKNQKNPNDFLEKENANLERKIKSICRGC